MEKLTNEELLDEFDLLEKEIEDETTVTDRRLVILERQKELFAQLRMSVRRRPTIQEYENLIDKLVGAVAIVQYDHLPKATLESYRLQATEAEAELLRRLGAAVSASPQSRFLDWVREKYPVLQNPILLNYGDSLTSNSMKGIDCATIVEEYAAQFFAAAPAQETPFSAEFVVQQEELRERNPELYEQASKNAVRIHEKLAAQEQPVENSRSVTGAINGCGCVCHTVGILGLIKG